ncbi:hypothetical protein P12x_004960 [Tundrisphaera lichenicola]|uniref:hypothetical protein n=1 Tax=Tundrisphaera lichenicola TaxID=2029860 RepID=UPI003EBC67B4
MMKSMFALIVLAGLMNAAPRAEAQLFRQRGTSSTPVASVASSPVVHRYSYYASSYPARGYVGYGTEDFPFYGRPYGHPYDPWTWPYMTGAYGQGLARYYDPPVK